MASLAEDLLTVLRQEKEGYDGLYTCAQQEREAVVARDLERLTEVTSEAADRSSQLKNLEKQRVQILKDMSVVLGHDAEILPVSRIIELLAAKQPEESRALEKAKNDLVTSATQMQFLNQQNQILLQQAMEMVDFDLTLYKSLRQAPETANYDRNAENSGDLLGGSGFDSRQ